MKNPIIVALDLPSPQKALKLAGELAPVVGAFKVGKQLFVSGGPDIVRKLRATGAKVFLDLKLHDIPNTVAKAVAAMKSAVDIPVTVKHRIGVDDLDAYEDMLNFVDVVARAGADRFSVHARKALRKALAPEANRSSPPQRFDDICRLQHGRLLLFV